MGPSNEQGQIKFKPGTELDINFTYHSKIINTRGHVKDSSDGIIVIELEVADKKMTPPAGTDIYVLGSSICYNVIDSKNFPEIKAVRVFHRKHVRVDNILKVAYKKISQENYNKYRYKPDLIYKSIFGESFKVPEVEKIDLKLLYKLIYQVNLKMDRILDILESESIKKYTLSENEYINISGAGVRFITDQAFSTGDIIAFRIFLPLAGQSHIDVLGKIIRVTKKKDKYCAAAKFVELSEDDREMIIKYVFKRQREILRLSSDYNEDIPTGHKISDG